MKTHPILCLALLIFTLAMCAACASNETGFITEAEQDEYIPTADTIPVNETEPEGVSEAMEIIWQIEDPDDFIIALNEYIGIKCQYGDDMAALSDPERIFYITQTLEMEVNNGGFSQFFYNSSGDFSNELVNAFHEIGAVKTAEICKRAISAFGTDIPTDRTARQDMLEACETDEVDEILNDCDMAFYEYEEDLTGLNYTYVLSHRESFT